MAGSSFTELHQNVSADMSELTKDLERMVEYTEKMSRKASFYQSKSAGKSGSCTKSCVVLPCIVLCCVVFTHSTADLDGSRHCGHADQPRTGLLDAEAGGRLSQMQSCGLWSPKDGQQPCSPCRSSPRLIYDSLPNIVPGIITALGNVLVFGLF